ncbi:MAG: alpha/beta hydrolase [Pseudomonadota bacterium]|nr:alpha/beta hydrolase [Pseudomonadota bacterium]MEE3072450.1 alpha/beta hydrolase [Pseudomonadota bacterium]
MNLDRAYENTAFIDGGSSYPARWKSQAEAFRIAQSARARLDQRYGEGRRHLYDLFLPEGAAKGLLVFIHGGYWKAFDKSYWSHLAAGAVAAGWAVAMPMYTLAPEARISEIVQEAAAAVATLADVVDGPIVLTGHSAGGHLSARLAVGDLLPKGVMHRIRRVVPISPVGDLLPMTQLEMNDILKISEDEALTESPVYLPAPRVPVTVWVGGAERPVFVEQAAMLARMWESPLQIADKRHHFDVIEDMAQGPLLDLLIA